jgi:hypothetical protein
MAERVIVTVDIEHEAPAGIVEQRAHDWFKGWGVRGVLVHKAAPAPTATGASERVVVTVDIEHEAPAGIVEQRAHDWFKGWGVCAVLIQKTIAAPSP